MEVLIRPSITEKSIKDVSQGKYVFYINSKANKVQVAEAVEKLYQAQKIKVQKVNIINIAGEEKMIKGRFKIRTKKIKKAIVTLKKGQKIAGFEEK